MSNLLRGIAGWCSPEWRDATLAEGRRPRFPERCLMCGAHRPNREWRLRVEGNRAGFAVPACGRCLRRRSLRRGATVLMFLLLLLAMGWFDVPLRPRGYNPGGSGSSTGLLTILAAFVGWLVMLVSGPQRPAYAFQVGARFRFSFRDLAYARCFAAENELVAPGTSADLLPPAPSSEAAAPDDKAPA